MNVAPPPSWSEAGSCDRDIPLMDPNGTILHVVSGYRSDGRPITLMSLEGSDGSVTDPIECAPDLAVRVNHRLAEVNAEVRHMEIAGHCALSALSVGRCGRRPTGETGKRERPGIAPGARGPGRDGAEGVRVETQTEGAHDDA